MPSTVDGAGDDAGDGAYTSSITFVGLAINRMTGWVPQYKVAAPATIQSCLLTVISQVTGATAFGPTAGTVQPDAGGYRVLSWPSAYSLPAGVYNYSFVPTVNGEGSARPAEIGPLTITAPLTPRLVLEIVGAGAAETIPQGSVQPIIFTFTPADGTSLLTLAGTPRFRLAAAAAQVTALIGPIAVTTTFGTGTASVQAAFLLDTTSLPPGVYIALCAAGIAGVDGLPRTIEAAAVIQILQGF